MIREFEGRSEKEAVAKAAEELGSDRFDVEVLNSGGGFFRLGKVKIRVEVPDGTSQEKKSSKRKSTPPASQGKPLPADVEAKICDFITNIVEKMGYTGEVKPAGQEGGKILLEIVSPNASILIGKKGKNLDALQLLANVYLGRLVEDKNSWRLVLDSEGYRHRREDSLVKAAKKAARETERHHTSCLLEPMNPFERRLVHTALNDNDSVITKSEGEGHYKRVRIIYKGSR